MTRSQLRLFFIKINNGRDAVVITKYYFHRNRVGIFSRHLYSTSSSPTYHAKNQPRTKHSPVCTTQCSSSTHTAYLTYGTFKSTHPICSPERTSQYTWRDLYIPWGVNLFNFGCNADSVKICPGLVLQITGCSAQASVLKSKNLNQCFPNNQNC